MIRIIAPALLLAVIVPFAMMVKEGVSVLPSEAIWFGAGIGAGLWISILLEAWDRRIRRRQGSPSNLRD